MPTTTYTPCTGSATAAADARTFTGEGKFYGKRRLGTCSTCLRFLKLGTGDLTPRHKDTR